MSIEISYLILDKISLNLIRKVGSSSAHLYDPFLYFGDSWVEPLGLLRGGLVLVF